MCGLPVVKLAWSHEALYRSKVRSSSSGAGELAALVRGDEHEQQAHRVAGALHRRTPQPVLAREVSAYDWDARRRPPGPSRSGARVARTLERRAARRCMRRRRPTDVPAGRRGTPARSAVASAPRPSAPSSVSPGGQPFITLRKDSLFLFTFRQVRRLSGCRAVGRSGGSADSCPAGSLAP
jgi:hypothetical protein